MGHKSTNTTLHYLRFQPDEIKQYFPSLIPIIESMEIMPKIALGVQILGVQNI